MKTQLDFEAVTWSIIKFSYDFYSTEQLARCLSMSLERLQDLSDSCREPDKDWWNTRVDEIHAITTMSSLLIERIRSDQERLEMALCDARNKFVNHQIIKEAKHDSVPSCLSTPNCPSASVSAVSANSLCSGV